MVILGTGYDAYLRKSEENCLGRIFASFSLISNTRILFEKNYPPQSVSTIKKEELAGEKRSFSWVYGLEAIAFVWLIIANVYQLGGLPITYLLSKLP